MLFGYTKATHRPQFEEVLQWSFLLESIIGDGLDGSVILGEENQGNINPTGLKLTDLLQIELIQGRNRDKYFVMLQVKI